MADTASAPVKSAKAKKPRVKPTHPPTNEMVHGAVSNLKERHGSSLIAIKKHIAATYKVDAEKLAPFIKKALKAGVTKGTLVQTKGKGASGSFKLASKEKTVKKAAPKKTPTKKAVTPKKAAAKKPSAGGDKKKSTKPAVKKPKTKTPSKAKKTKTPSKKPKAPKAKKSPAKKVARKSVVKK